MGFSEFGKFSWLSLFFVLFRFSRFYLFNFWRGKGGRKTQNHQCMRIHWSVVLHMPRTGNRTSDFLVPRLVLNSLSNTRKGWLVFPFLFVCLFVCLSFLFYLFLEGKGGRKRGRETSLCGCLSCGPHWGSVPQPRHVPRLGIELVTPWFTARAQSTELYIPARAD